MGMTCRHEDPRYILNGLCICIPFTDAAQEHSTEISDGDSDSSGEHSWGDSDSASDNGDDGMQ